MKNIIRLIDNENSCERYKKRSEVPILKNIFFSLNLSSYISSFFCYFFQDHSENYQANPEAIFAEPDDWSFVVRQICQRSFWKRNRPQAIPRACWSWPSGWWILPDSDGGRSGMLLVFRRLLPSFVRTEKSKSYFCYGVVVYLQIKRLCLTG